VVEEPWLYMKGLKSHSKISNFSKYYTYSPIDCLISFWVVDSSRFNPRLAGFLTSTTGATSFLGSSTLSLD